MLTWAAIFLVIALIAGVFGFRGIEGIAEILSKVVFRPLSIPSDFFL